MMFKLILKLFLLLLIFLMFILIICDVDSDIIDVDSDIVDVDVVGSSIVIDVDTPTSLKSFFMYRTRTRDNSRRITSVTAKITQTIFCFFKIAVS